MKQTRLFFVAGLFAWLSLSEPAYAAKRAAVIGFSEYSWTPLPGVVVDTERIAGLLRSDYKVTVIDNQALTREDFRARWKLFVQSIDDQDEVVIYYAGHAIDVGGANYLIPLAAQKPTGAETLSSLAIDFLKLRDLVTEVQDRTPAVAFWIIDACRDNPYSKRVRGNTKEVGLSRELLTPPDSYYGSTVLFFSADFGQSALDTIPQGNQALLDQIPGSDKGMSPFAVAFMGVYLQSKAAPLMLFMQYVANLTANLAKPTDQRPQPQGFPPNNYCLAECKSALVQISFSSVDGKRTTFDPREEPDDPLSSAPKIDDLKQIGNAIFVGKLSKQSCSGNESSDDYPFGCEFLKKAASIAQSDGRFDPGAISATVAQIDVNIRRSSPRIEDEKLYYDCKVGVLRAGKAVKFKGVAAYKSVKIGDTLLFAVVDAEPVRQCAF